MKNVKVTLKNSIYKFWIKYYAKSELKYFLLTHKHPYHDLLNKSDFGPGTQYLQTYLQTATKLYKDCFLRQVHSKM